MRYLILFVFVLMPHLVFAAGNTLEWLPSNLRLCTNTPGISSAQNPEVAADGTFVVAVWEDDRNEREDIYCNFSIDGGKTWQTGDVRLNTNTAGASYSRFPAVAVSGSRACVAWLDTRHGQADIFVNHSSDYGQTWSASDVRLNLGSGEGEKTCQSVKVHASGDSFYVTWIETRFGYYEGLFINYSTDGGTTWQPTDRQIDDGTCDVYTWQIASDGATVYAMWWYGTNVYFDRSVDNGAHWMATDHRVNVSDGDNYEPVFAVEGSTIYVFWDRYNSSLYTKRINYNHSDNGGVSWDGSDTELSFGSNPRIALADGVVHLTNIQNDSLYYRQYTAESGWKDPVVVRDYDVKDFDSPAVALQDSLVFLAWYDQVCIDESLRYNYSLNGGRSFASTGIPLFLNDNACTTARVDDPRVAVSGKNIYVIWQDYRNTLPDIYFTMSTIPCKTLPFLNLLLD